MAEKIPDTSSPAVINALVLRGSQRHVEAGTRDWSSEHENMRKRVLGGRRKCQEGAAREFSSSARSKPAFPSFHPVTFEYSFNNSSAFGWEAIWSLGDLIKDMYC